MKKCTALLLACLFSLSACSSATVITAKDGNCLDAVPSSFAEKKCYSFGPMHPGATGALVPLMAATVFAAVAIAVVEIGNVPLQYNKCGMDLAAVIDDLQKYLFMRKAGALHPINRNEVYGQATSSDNTEFIQASAMYIEGDTIWLQLSIEKISYTPANVNFPAKMDKLETWLLYREIQLKDGTVSVSRDNVAKEEMEAKRELYDIRYTETLLKR